MNKKFALSMVEYSKFILTKMSFSRTLFRKEYTKAIQNLNVEERIQLKNWVRMEWRTISTKTECHEMF